MVDDDDDSPQSANLSQILRRHSLTTNHTQPSPTTPTAPPPLGQRLSGDMRYAQQLQEEEEKAAKREEEGQEKGARASKAGGGRSQVRTATAAA